MSEKKKASSAAAAPAPGSALTEVNVSLRIAGWGSAVSFEGSTDVESFLVEVAKDPEYEGLRKPLLRAFRVPRTEEQVAAAEFATTEADAKKAGTLLLPGFHTINDGDYILVVQVPPAQGGGSGASAAATAPTVPGAAAAPAPAAPASAPAADSAHLDLERRMIRLELRDAPAVVSPSSHSEFYAASDKAPLHVLCTSRAFVLPEPPPADSAEVAVQADMRQLLTVHLPDPTRHTAVFVDRHTVTSFGTRKPDFVAYLANTDGVGRRPAVGGAGSGSSAAEPAASAVLEPIALDASHVVLIGDVKHRRGNKNDGAFTAEEKGHVIGMLADLVKQQPYRASSLGGGGGGAHGVGIAYAFVSDGKHIIIFRVTFSVVGSAVAVSRVEETLPLLLRSIGMQCLDALLGAAPAALGFVDPIVTLPDGLVLQLRKLLGAGATSLVYLADRTSPPSSASSSSVAYDHQYAVKILTGTPEHMHQEVVVFEHLAHSSVCGSPHLLRLVAICTVKMLMVFSPVCRTAYSLRTPPPALPLSQLGQRLSPADALLTWRPSAAELCDMADALADLHTGGVVHRDPRPENFMRDSAGNMVVLDLGAAVQVGSRHDIVRPWGFTYGPLRVLDAMARAEELPVAVPADDFEQLARVAVVTASGACAEFGWEPKAADLLKHWRDLEASLAAQAEADADGAAAAARDLLALVAAPAAVDVSVLKAAIRRLLR